MLTVKLKLGYSIGAYGLFIIWSGASLFMLYFYTDVLLLDPEIAGSIFFLALIWDGITDPVMGMITDRTNTRWGQYRPYLLFGSVPLALSYYLAYSKPDIDADTLLIYVLVTHLVFRTCYTIVYVPFTAYVSKLTKDSNERSNLTGYKVIFTQLGTLSISLFMLKLVEWFGNGNEAMGFSSVALYSGLIGAFFILFCYVATGKENMSEKEAYLANKYSASEVFTSIKANYPFILILLSTLLFMTSYIMIMKGTVYYAKYYLGNKDMISVLLSIITGTAIVSVPIFIKITAMTSKRFVWFLGNAATSIGLLIIYVLPYFATTRIILSYFLVAIGVNAILMNFYSMLADTVEYGEWKTGIKCEAILFGFGGFCLKAGVGLGGGLLGLFLSYFGFVANASQADSALQGLKLTVTVIPAISMLITVLLVAYYPINAVFHRQISEAISLRKQKV